VHTAGWLGVGNRAAVVALVSTVMAGRQRVSSGRPNASAYPAPRDGSNLGAVIRAYMRANGIATNGEMAAVLGIDRTLVSRYVSGTRKCHDVVQLRRFAEAMDLAPETFGLLPEPREVADVDSTDTEEATEWRLVRQTLNRHRHELSTVAADLYWTPQRIEGTSCITRPAWMPTQPVDFAQIKLAWLPESPRPALNGGEPQSAACRPHGPTGARYTRYSQRGSGSTSHCASSTSTSPPTPARCWHRTRTAHGDWSASATRWPPPGTRSACSRASPAAAARRNCAAEPPRAAAATGAPAAPDCGPAPAAGKTASRSSPERKA
jgi:hypothetical protein